MSTFQFFYRDGTGICITRTHVFETEASALAAAALTFERFGVQVVHDGREIGRFPPCMTVGIEPRDDIVML